MEYSIENHQMRGCLSRIKDFAKYERRIEAVEYMFQISQRKLMFESLIQWVRVVYAEELGKKFSPE